MLSKGQSLEIISLWMGHSIIQRTWKSYKLRPRFHLKGYLTLVSRIYKIWGVYLIFAALPAIALDPKLKAQIDPCGPAFAALANGQAVERDKVYKVLRSKFEMRLLGEGGPIEQPTFYVGISPETEVVARLAGTHGKAVENGSVNTALTGQHRTLPIDGIGKNIDDGTIQLPLVVKPNLGAHGNKIMFLERVGDLVTITMAHSSPDSFHKFEGTTQLISELKKMGITDVQVDEQHQLAKITFNPTKHRLSEVLIRAWKQLTTEEHFVKDWTGNAVSWGEYDGGMIESMMVPFKYQGRAYETRHKFDAAFDQGVTKLIKTKDDGAYWNLETPGSFARLGSSPYFSNQTGRTSTEKAILPSTEMYNPLFEEFKISGARRQEFVQYVDGLIRAQVAHYFERLRQSGIRLDEEMSGQIDLMWLPPDSPNSFPKPVVIESSISYDSQLSKNPIIVTKPGGKP